MFLDQEVSLLSPKLPCIKKVFVEGLTSHPYRSRSAQRSPSAPLFRGQPGPVHDSQPEPPSGPTRRSLWGQAYGFLFPSASGYLASLSLPNSTKEHLHQFISGSPHPLAYAAGVSQLLKVQKQYTPENVESLYKLFQYAEDGNQIQQFSRQIRRLHVKGLLNSPADFLKSLAERLEKAPQSLTSITETLSQWPPVSLNGKANKALAEAMLSVAPRLYLNGLGTNFEPDSLQSILEAIHGQHRMFSSLMSSFFSLESTLSSEGYGPTALNDLFTHFLRSSRTLKELDSLWTDFRSKMRDSFNAGVPPSVIAYLFQLSLQTQHPEHLAAMLEIASPQNLSQWSSQSLSFYPLESFVDQHHLYPKSFYRNLNEKFPGFLLDEGFFQLLKDLGPHTLTRHQVSDIVMSLAMACASLQTLDSGRHEEVRQRLRLQLQTDPLQLVKTSQTIAQIATPLTQARKALWRSFLEHNLDPRLLETLQQWRQQPPASELSPNQQAAFLVLLADSLALTQQQPEMWEKFIKTLTESVEAESLPDRVNAAQCLLDAGVPVHEVTVLLYMLNDFPPGNQYSLAQALSTPPPEVDPNDLRRNPPFSPLSEKDAESPPLYYNLTLNHFRHNGLASSPLDLDLLAETFAVLKQFPSPQEFRHVLKAFNAFGGPYPSVKTRLKLFSSLASLPPNQQHHIVGHLAENLLTYTRYFQTQEYDTPFTDAHEFQEVLDLLSKEGEFVLLKKVARASQVEDVHEFLNLLRFMQEQPPELRERLFSFIERKEFSPTPMLTRITQDKRRVLDLEQLKKLKEILNTYPEEVLSRAFVFIPEEVPSIEHWQVALEVFSESLDTVTSAQFYNWFPKTLPGLIPKHKWGDVNAEPPMSPEAFRQGVKFLVASSQPTTLLNYFLMNFEKIPVEFIKYLYEAVEYRIPVHTGKQSLPELTAIIPLYLKQVQKKGDDASYKAHSNQLSAGLTRIYDYIGGHQRISRIEPVVLDTWSRLGTLGLSFSKWRFDTMGRWKGQGPMEAPSLFELSGLFQKMPPRSNDERFHGGYYLNIPEKQLSIELRRAYIVISSAEHGTLVIRNSSPHFGRDLLPEMANFLPGHYYPLPESPLNPCGHVTWEDETSVFAKALHGNAEQQLENHGHMQALLDLFDEAMAPYVHWKCGFRDGLPSAGFNQLLRAALLSTQNIGNASPFGKQKNLRLAWVDPFGVPTPLQSFDLSQPSAQKEIAFYLNPHRRNQNGESLEANLPTFLPFLSEGLSKGWELILAPEVS